MGRPGDGGVWVCDVNRIPKKACLVYSVGSLRDLSFVNAVREQISHNCEIHAFSPDAFSKSVPSNQLKDAGITFHPWGLAHTTDEGRNMYTLDDMLRKLKHQGRTIDVFRINCEGCEFSSQWWNSAATLRQVQVRMHGTRTVEGGIWEWLRMSASGKRKHNGECHEVLDMLSCGPAYH